MGLMRKLFCPHCNHFWIYKLEIEEHLHDKESLGVSCYFCKKFFVIRRNYIQVYLSRSLYAADLKYKYPVSVRKKCEGLLSLIDPVDISDLGTRAEKICSSQIVVVCMQTLHSTDPFFELMYAWSNSIPCYVIDIGRQFSTDKWVHACAEKVFTEVDNCFDAILPAVSVKDNRFLLKLPTSLFRRETKCRQLKRESL